MKAQRLSLNHEKVHVASLREYVQNNCLGLDWSKTVLGLLRSRSWSKLLSIASELDESLLFIGSPGWVGHSCMSDDAVYRVTAQFVAMVKKYPYTPQQMPGLDPDEAALRALETSERRNKRLNDIFRGYRVRGLWRHPLHRHIKSVFSRVLGEQPPLRDIYAHCDFSNGAGVGISGNATHLGVKLDLPIAVTPTALPHFVSAVLLNHQVTDYFLRVSGFNPEILDPLGKILYAEESVRNSVRYVGHNEICCVPKRWDRSRTIAKEPAGNNFVQKGTDSWMRSALLRTLNLDLTEQSINQVMALEGSLDGVTNPYVTIDVKDASNGVLIELARAFCSKEWFSFLNETRCSSGVWPDGVERRYELFSSMGNGFTFPLETLLFAAVCIAAYRATNQKPDFRVYGDDIIVRQDVALLVIELLSSLGFRTNTDKTFVFGPFRESCGANWYRGKPVVPVYWDNHIKDRAALMQMHNAMLRVCTHTSQLLRSFDPECPYVVPDDAQYAWVTNQAFRVSQDVWMAHPGVVWRRDTRSWRYPQLLQLSLPDAAFGTQLNGSSFRAVWWAAMMRGATPSSPFPLRRTTRFSPVRPPPDSKLECALARQFGRVSWHWDVNALQTFLLLRRGGYSQHRANETMHGWYGRGGRTVK